MNMVRCASLVLALAFAHVTGAQEVYKTVDENGKVIFSDKPQKDSVEVDVDLKNVQPAVNVRAPTKKNSSKAAPVEYALRVVSPTNGEQIGPTQRSLSIQASITPRLRGGHYFQFFFDGEALGQPRKSTSASIPLGIKKRGKRQVGVKVVDKSGRVLASASSVSVYVIRP